MKDLQKDKFTYFLNFSEEDEGFQVKVTLELFKLLEKKSTSYLIGTSFLETLKLIQNIWHSNMWLMK